MISKELRGIIIGKYGSVAEFARQLDMPYSVLRCCLSGQSRIPEKIKRINDDLGIDIKPFIRMKKLKDGNGKLQNCSATFPPENHNNRISKYLHSIIVRKYDSIAGLARDLGLKRSALHRYLTGRRRNPEQLERISEKLSVDVTNFIPQKETNPVNPVNPVKEEQQ